MSAGVPAGRSQVIVVAGATGRQGGAVARRLMADGWVVRGLSRDPKSRKAARARAAGIQVVQADMADRGSLAPALAGAYGLFSVQNPMICGHEMEVVQGKKPGRRRCGGRSSTCRLRIRGPWPAEHGHSAVGREA